MLGFCRVPSVSVFTNVIAKWVGRQELLGEKMIAIKMKSDY